MEYIQHCTGVILFFSTGSSGVAKRYSERSTIEIRGDNNGKFILRALDVEHGNQEIFNVYLRHSTNYDLKSPSGSAYELRLPEGRYILNIKADTANGFYETFQNCAAEIQLLDDEPTNSRSFGSSSGNRTNAISIRSFDKHISDTGNINDNRPISDQSSHSLAAGWSTDSNSAFPHPLRDNPSLSFSSDSDEEVYPDTPPENDLQSQSILKDIHRFSDCIKNGRCDDASNIAKQLASMDMRLKVKELAQVKTETSFEIMVQIDGTAYGADQNGPRVPVEVFPSTTVRELRAAFELKYKYLPSSQYMFANGTLVYDESTMRDLKVGPSSLFVLFLLEDSRA